MKRIIMLSAAVVFMLIAGTQSSSAQRHDFANYQRYAKEKGVEELIAVGALSKNMADAFGTAQYYESTDALVAALNGMDLKGKNILVKASHGMHFEKVIEALTK